MLFFICRVLLTFRLMNSMLLKSRCIFDHNIRPARTVTSHLRRCFTREAKLNPLLGGQRLWNSLDDRGDERNEEHDDEGSDGAGEQHVRQDSPESGEDEVRRDADRGLEQVFRGHNCLLDWDGFPFNCLFSTREEKHSPCGLEALMFETVFNFSNDAFSITH